MDSLSVSKLNRLYWLGRYYERLATTLGYLWDWYDVMIDGEIDYPDFCRKLSIDCCYKDDKDFMHNYVFDKNNPDSLRTVADAMLGNGMVLREVIGSRTLAYLELAVMGMKSAEESDSPTLPLQMKSAEESDSPTLPLQRVIDFIMAFRGSYDDMIDDENVRNIIKCAAGVERLSLYLRLGWHLDSVKSEIGKLMKRMNRTSLQPSHAVPCFAAGIVVCQKPGDSGRTQKAAGSSGESVCSVKKVSHAS